MSMAMCSLSSPGAISTTIPPTRSQCRHYLPVVTELDPTMRRSLLKYLFLILALYCLCFIADAADTAVVFSGAPRDFSPSPSAAFVFHLSDAAGLPIVCSNCTFTCSLDGGDSSDCSGGEMRYAGLGDGNHTVVVCAAAGIRRKTFVCAARNWVIDTVPPTASIRVSSAFTAASTVSVIISFSEPCPDGGGFRCSPSRCNLLVYGAGEVVPSSLMTLRPSLQYSISVAISPAAQYGRIFLAMDRAFCTDGAGNRFTRTLNSTFILHYDRRSVKVSMTAVDIPQQLIELGGEIRSVMATNDEKRLWVHLSFSEPVMNSSMEILTVLQTSAGRLVPAGTQILSNRWFSFMVTDVPSVVVLTITCQASSIISRQGTPVLPSDPLTFLYDDRKPDVRLLASRQPDQALTDDASVLIQFSKPVFNFNSSAVRITGGTLLRFREASRSLYWAQIRAAEEHVSVEVSESAAMDIAGNANSASNRLQLTRYSTPALSMAASTFTTTVLLATAAVATLLTMSTASLTSSGMCRLSAMEPSRSLMRIVCHVQAFALFRWLPANMPLEYDEFARGIEWVIPHLPLPWTNNWGGSFPDAPAEVFSQLLLRAVGPARPLLPSEYVAFFERQNMKPLAQFIPGHQKSSGWVFFGQNIFWLGVIGGGLVGVHSAVLLALRAGRMRRKGGAEGEVSYGVLVFPRFEVFLAIVALPSLCQASVAVIDGGTRGGIIAGMLLLAISAAMLLSLLVFLTAGITMGRALQYREVRRDGDRFQWYHELLKRTLGPGKRGQWTWKYPGSAAAFRPLQLGPLFEDLRGPPKYMVSQIAGESSVTISGDHRIIPSEDETEDAEAPLIEKFFGVLRIYYVAIDLIKRAAIGALAGLRPPPPAGVVGVLSVAGFQLVFLALKKPFIKKRVQLVELISVAGEVCVLAACVVVDHRNPSAARKRQLGYALVAIFLLQFLLQMANEWLALWRHLVLLGGNRSSVLSGIRAAANGLRMLVCLWRLPEEPAAAPATATATVTAGDQRSWVRQLSELAKASFSKESSQRQRDQSSASVVQTAPADGKVDTEGLYRDLQAIFSSSSSR